jgi:putative transposase
MAALPDAFQLEHSGCVPESHSARIAFEVAPMFEAPDTDTARVLLDGIIDDLGARDPGAIGRLEAGFEDAMAVMALPESVRKRLRTTNCA